MMRNLPLRRLVLIAALALPLLSAATPAHANVSTLVLYRRTCAYVTAYAVYDSFSVGTAPFYAAFTVDLDGDGQFGELGEPTRFVTVTPGSSAASTASTRIRFAPQPEGSVIRVTVYEVDSAGVVVSAPVAPVEYVCANRPALDPLPPNTGIVIPGVGTVARVIAEAVNIYSAPNADSTLLGALGNGQLANVRGRNRRGDWVQIDFKGGTGWFMWQTQARLIGPFAGLPVVE